MYRRGSLDMAPPSFPDDLLTRASTPVGHLAPEIRKGVNLVVSHRQKNEFASSR